MGNYKDYDHTEWAWYCEEPEQVEEVKSEEEIWEGLSEEEKEEKRAEIAK